MIPQFNWYLPNRKTLTSQYLPSPVQLPDGDLKALVFDFPALAARATAEKSKALPRKFLCWGIAANDTDAAGYRVQIYGLHGQQQQPAFLRHITDSDVLGTAQKPTLLKSTRLFQQGDTITVEVRNLSANAGANIQVVLWGVELA